MVDQIRKTVYLAAVAAFALLAAGCTDPRACQGSGNHIMLISFDGQAAANSPSQFALRVNDTTTVVAGVHDTDACGNQSKPLFTSREAPAWFRWSSDARVLTVDSRGTMHGVAVGQVEVKVEGDGSMMLIRVDVIPPVANLVIRPHSATVRVGDTLRFDAYLVDSAGNPIALPVIYPYPVDLSPLPGQSQDVVNMIPGNRLQLLKRFERPGTYHLNATTVVRNVKLENATVVTVVP